MAGAGFGSCHSSVLGEPDSGPSPTKGSSAPVVRSREEGISRLGRRSLLPSLLGRGLGRGLCPVGQLTSQGTGPPSPPSGLPQRGWSCSAQGLWPGAS